MWNKTGTCKHKKQGSYKGFLCSSVSEESACSAGDPGLIPELGRSPGEGHGNPLQYPCLENPWTEEPGGCSPWGCKESGTIEQLILTVLLKGGVQAARQSKANKEAKLVERKVCFSFILDASNRTGQTPVQRSTPTSPWTSSGQELL